MRMVQQLALAYKRKVGNLRVYGAVLFHPFKQVFCSHDSQFQNFQEHRSVLSLSFRAVLACFEVPAISQTMACYSRVSTSGYAWQRKAKQSINERFLY